MRALITPALSDEEGDIRCLRLEPLFIGQVHGTLTVNNLISPRGSNSQL